MPNERQIREVKENVGFLAESCRMLGPGFEIAVAVFARNMLELAGKCQCAGCKALLAEWEKFVPLVGFPLEPTGEKKEPTVDTAR